MPDAPTASATAPTAPPPEAPKVEAKPYRFKFKGGEGFSLDALLIKGFLQADVQLSDQMVVSYRTLSVDQLQQIESVIDVQNVAVTGKYQANELTIAQIYHSVQALNNKDIPRVPPTFGTRDYKPETDQRRTWIRNLPGVLFDLITSALTEFERHAKELISPESVRNF
jgi:hypothetical protein